MRLYIHINVTLMYTLYYVCPAASLFEMVPQNPTVCVFLQVHTGWGLWKRAVWRSVAEQKSG